MSTATATRTSPTSIALTVCRHGIEAAWCSMCKNPEPVFITGGGTHYHRTAACPSLRSGQDKVLRRGGVTAAIRRSTKSSALAMGRTACHTCWKSRR